MSKPYSAFFRICLLLIALSALSCTTASNDVDTASPETEAQEKKAGAEEEVGKGVVADRDFSIAVISEGEEPRKLLRYDLQEGRTELAGMKIQLAVANSLGENQVPKVKTPPIEIPFTVKVEEIDESENITLSVVYQEPVVSGETSLDSQYVEGVRQELQKFTGTKCRSVITNQGKIIKANCEFPESMDAQIAQMVNRFNQGLEQSFVSLPSQSLGVGASWNVSLPSFLENKIKNVKSEVTYEIVGMDENIIELKVRTSETAPEQPYEVSGTRSQNAKIQLLSLNVDGSGMINLNLERVIPDVRMSSSGLQTLRITRIDDGQEQSVEMKTLIETSMQMSSEDLPVAND